METSGRASFTLFFPGREGQFEIVRVARGARAGSKNCPNYIIDSNANNRSDVYIVIVDNALLAINGKHYL